MFTKRINIMYYCSFAICVRKHLTRKTQFYFENKVTKKKPLERVVSNFLKD